MAEDIRASAGRTAAGRASAARSTPSGVRQRAVPTVLPRSMSDAKDQVAVLELGKDIVRATLPIVETRSGKKVEYQDDEARKSANK